MKKLNKAQYAKLTELGQDLSNARDTLNSEIEAFNAAMEERWKAVTEKLEALNEKVQAAEEFRSEIYTEMEDYHGERSERWQESDAGSAYSAWMEAWENEVSEVELEMPDDLEPPDVESLEAFEELSEEP